MVPANERSFIMAKKNSTTVLFSSLLYIIMGILLIVSPGETLNLAMKIIGIFFVVSGTLDVVRKNFMGGAVSLVIGIAILVLGGQALDILLLVLGILIAVKGTITLFEVLSKKRKNALEVVFPILSIIVGLALAFGKGFDYIMLVVGVLLVIDGVIGLIGALKK